MIDFYGKTFYNTGLQPNYLIGEECQYAGTVRDMSNPNVTNGADTYGGTFWLNPNCTPAQNNNWCGIHFNLGVQNFWFYLLSEGGSGTNDLGNQYCVDGIGRDKAARIAYRSLTTYLTPNSGYYSARYWSIQSALDLYGANSNEVAQVINAWYAVGLGSSSFNGSVIYNNLTIPPFSGTLTLSNNNAMLFNNLQVMPSGNLTVISNKRITMKPVSKASSGSYFHAYIDPNCLGGLAETPSNRIINGDSSIVKQENINNEVMYQNKVFISPNPTNGKFQLIIDREWMVNQMIQVVIYNNLGQTIYQSAISNLQSVIDLSSHPKGIYFIKIQTAEKIYTEKVVVQ